MTTETLIRYRVDLVPVNSEGNEIPHPEGFDPPHAGILDVNINLVEPTTNDESAAT